MVMCDIPTRTASVVTDVTGTTVITIPPIRVTIPKKIHQPRPSREPPDEATPEPAC
jgi:hypothetical protein